MPLPASRPTPFKIEHGGKSWSGDWRLMPSGEISVSSAYGSAAKKRGNCTEKRRAELILLDLVKAWCAR